MKSSSSSSSSPQSSPKRITGGKKSNSSSSTTSVSSSSPPCCFPSFENSPSQKSPKFPNLSPGPSPPTSPSLSPKTFTPIPVQQPLPQQHDINLPPISQFPKRSGSGSVRSLSNAPVEEMGKIKRVGDYVLGKTVGVGSLGTQRL